MKIVIENIEDSIDHIKSNLYFVKSVKNQEL